MRPKSRQDLEVLTEAQFINFLIALLGPFVIAVDILTYSFSICTLGLLSVNNYLLASPVFSTFSHGPSSLLFDYSVLILRASGLLEESLPQGWRGWEVSQTLAPGTSC